MFTTDPFEYIDDAAATPIISCFDRRRIARVGIDNHQDSNLPCVEVLIVNEVHRPDTVPSGWCLAVATQLGLDLPLRLFIPDLQAFLAVKPVDASVGPAIQSVRLSGGNRRCCAAGIRKGRPLGFSRRTELGCRRRNSPASTGCRNAEWPNVFSNCMCCLHEPRLGKYAKKYRFSASRFPTNLAAIEIQQPEDPAKA